MNFVPPVVNVSQDVRRYNDPIYGTRGEFSMSTTVSVPYFIALLDIATLERELKTHEQVAPSLDNAYSLIELYQRQIDEDRVEKDIVDAYLNIPDKLKFFNALTVALLPKSENGSIQRDFENYPNNDPEIPVISSDEYDRYFNDPRFSKSVFGGVQFVSSPTHNLARLRWDRNRVDAVAVDGQHRLRALQIWFQRKQGALNPDERKTRIPVIFLLLHESAGFRSPASMQQFGIKAIAREIFTDLNKNAKEVDLATQIILDDRSIEACCVRRIITEGTGQDHEKLLPLSLLRWQDANYKFDTSYYLNSLVNLFLVVKDLLDIEPPKDSTDKSEVLKFIQKYEQTLGRGPSRRIEVEGVSLKDYYLSNYCDKVDNETFGDPHTPFSNIPPHFLPAAELGFDERYSHWILSLLTKLSPYAELLKYARNNRLITGEMAQYYAQPKSHRKTIETAFVAKYGEGWRQEVLTKHEDEIANLKRHDVFGERWAFKTLFQKAYVELGKEIFIDLGDDSNKYGSVDDFIWFFNRLEERNLLFVQSALPDASHSLWTSVSVNYGSKKIKVTNTSRKRMLGVLRLWYFGWRYLISSGRSLAQVGNEEQSDSVTSAWLLKHFSYRTNSLDWPKALEAIDEVKKGFASDAEALSGPTELENSDARAKVADERLRKLFDFGLRNVASS